MAAWTLEFAQGRLAKWLEAEESVAVTGQSYTIDIANTRRILTKADLKLIAQQIAFWRREVEILSTGNRGRMRAKFIIPRDG